MGKKSLENDVNKRENRLKKINMKIITIVIVIQMIVSGMPAIAFAAEASMSNFTATKSYQNNFTDVASSYWAADSIKTCYEYSLMNGKSDILFSPKGNLRICEAIAMADRIHEIYITGTSTLQNGDWIWYEPYMEYAISEGIIASTDFEDPQAYVTRSQMAYIFYNAIPKTEYNELNTIDTLPDVDETEENNHEIKALYKAGVLTGNDSYGTYRPASNITRAEAATILTRVAIKSERKTFALQTKDDENQPGKNDDGDEKSDDGHSGDELTAGEIYTKCAPAVVYISVYDAKGEAIQSGSGFFIDSNGTLVTNYHVMEGGTSAKVTTTDNKIYDILGYYDYDKERDIALLKVDGNDFSYLNVCEDAVSAGDTVYAIGSPLGLSNTISSGIVSNAARYYEGQDYIQVTAPISSGSSGGALIDSYGDVIGITSGAIYTEQGVSQNLNLAVPALCIASLARYNVTSVSDVTYAESAELIPSTDSVTIKKGSTTMLLVTHTSEVKDMSIHSQPDDPTVAACKWGKWTSEDTAQLYIIGRSVGTTTVRISFSRGETSARTATIKVTVVE